MFRLYIIGISILAIAILANGIVPKLGIKSWYDFFNLLKDYGASTFTMLSILDYLWLFLVYPLLLAFGYKIGDKLHQLMF